MPEEDKEKQDNPMPEEKKEEIPIKTNYAEVLKKGDETASRIEAAVKKNDEILQQFQELEARRTFGGNTDSAIKPEEKKEETPKEYKDRIMRGEV